MRPFPPGKDLAFLIGQEIGQVRLDPWSTQFRFADGGQITLEGPVEHLDVQGHAHRHQHLDAQDRGPVVLHDLLQTRIVALHREDWRLTLTFETGAELRIDSEDGPYESGQIYPPGKDGEIIVF